MGGEARVVKENPLWIYPERRARAHCESHCHKKIPSSCVCCYLCVNPPPPKRVTSIRATQIMCGVLHSTVSFFLSTHNLEHFILQLPSWRGVKYTYIDVASSSALCVPPLPDRCAKCNRTLPGSTASFAQSS